MFDEDVRAFIAKWGNKAPTVRILPPPSLPFHDPHRNHHPHCSHSLELRDAPASTIVVRHVSSCRSSCACMPFGLGERTGGGLHIHLANTPHSEVPRLIPPFARLSPSHAPSNCTSKNTYAHTLSVTHSAVTHTTQSNSSAFMSFLLSYASFFTPSTSLHIHAHA